MSAPRESAPDTLDRYRWSRSFPTRWNAPRPPLHDPLRVSRSLRRPWAHDVFGHLNNTVHYAAMDTTVTAWLLTEAGHAPGAGADVEPAFVVSSSCRYLASAAFPDVLVVGLRADRVGTTSVSWGLGIFREADRQLLASGTFIHGFVDPTTQRPVPVPAALRARIEADLVPAPPLA